jgi:hypothetical protein
MDDGSLPSVKIGIRRLILSRQPPPRDRNPKRYHGADQVK